MTTTDPDRATLGSGVSSGEHGGVRPEQSDGERRPDSSSADGPVSALQEAVSGPQPVESRAAIAGHPIHPMLVPLPIGALVGAMIADVAYLRTRDPFWARSARHLTDAGLIATALAAVPGIVDFSSRERIRERPEAWVHAVGNVAVFGLTVLSRTLRAADERSAAAGPGIAISLASTAILGLGGWMGGELSYRHRIGVTNT